MVEESYFHKAVRSIGIDPSLRGEELTTVIKKVSNTMGLFEVLKTVSESIIESIESNPAVAHDELSMMEDDISYIETAILNTDSVLANASLCLVKAYVEELIIKVKHAPKNVN